MTGVGKLGFATSAAVMTLVLAGSPGAGTPDRSQPPPEGTVQTVTPPPPSPSAITLANPDGRLYSDVEVAAIMKSEQVPESEAQDILRDLLLFSDLTGQLREAFPDTFVASRVGWGPFSLHVSFTTLTDISKFPLDVLSHPVQVESVPGATEAELEKLRTQIFQRLDETKKTDGTMTALDGEAGVVRVVLPSSFDVAADAELQALLRNPLVALDMNGAEGAAFRPEIVRGGGRMRKPNGDNWCTTGFSVISSIQVTGIASAGHCRDANKYVRPSDGVEVFMLLQSYVEGNDGDFSWYTTAENEPPEFYAHDGNIRNVYSVRGAASFSQDDHIWYYGRSSGGGDAYVKYTSTSCENLDSLVMMKTSPTAGGDSGGPWYVNGQANGIHTGLCEVSPNVFYSIFSKAAKLQNLSTFNVTIRLAPF